MNNIDRVTKFGLTCDVDTRHFYCGHEYVEIGGIKWATMNVGANSPTKSGMYFQWGDTQGYTAEEVGRGGKYFDWASYKYRNSTSRIITKYNATDGKTVLESSDDAVTAAWGGDWRMPTKEEFDALSAAVNTAWTEDYQGSGVAGLVLTDKEDSSKVLFFPSAGCAINGCVGGVGCYGLYWSSSLYSGSVNCSYGLFFNSGGMYWGVSNEIRYYGCLVRGVLGDNS